MRKYIAPELEIVNFACEDIITVSGGEITPQNVLTVDTSNGGVVAFSNGSMEFTY